MPSAQDWVGQKPSWWTLNMDYGHQLKPEDQRVNEHSSPLPLSSTEAIEQHHAIAEDMTPRGSAQGYTDGGAGEDCYSDHYETPISLSSDVYNGPVLPTSPRESDTGAAYPSAENSPSGDYFTTTIFRPTGSISVVNSNTPSNLTSPLQSAYASSTSLHSSQVGSAPTDEDFSGDTLPCRTRAVLDPNPKSSMSCPTTPGNSADPAPRPLTQRSTQQRQEGPKYPDQSFAALHSQQYPPSYQPNQLRPQGSHLSSASGYSSSSSRQSHDRSSITSGARTVGNTPAGSPGLFPDVYMRNKASGDDSEETPNNASLLHPTHLQAPKETHKLLKDIDPISGRKIINNYEFYSKLGSGAHGTVKLGRNLVTNDLVAIKIVRRFSKKIRLGKQDSPEDMVKKEVAVLKKARHPHVVSLLEVIDDPEFGKVYLILEYVELGEIIWRKKAEKEVAQFEMDRAKREVSGIVNNEAEVEYIKRFNEGVPARLAQKDKLFTERLRQTHEHTIDDDTMAANVWSLEHGGETEDELERRTLPGVKPNTQLGMSQSSFTPGSAERFSSYEACPSPNTSVSQEFLEATQLDIENNYSPITDSRSTPPPSLEGTMWGPYAAEQIGPQPIESAFPSTLQQVFEEHTTWTEEEEEFSHVPCLTLSQALEAFRDTVLGLEYLHFQGIIHRDIKPANLLWTKDYRVKISDFGVSYLGRPIREDENNEEIEEANAANLDEAIELAKTVGTPAFYAPELCDPDLFNSEKHPERPLITGQIDVWALGITLYCMVFGRLPFFDVNEFSMYEKIARQEVFIPSVRLRGVEDDSTIPKSNNKRMDAVLEYDVVDDELRDLLKRLLEKQPLKRITLKEVKHHPWVLRGVGDQAAWIDDTDPSVQSQGKKIEVSSQEVSEAVAPLTFIDRIKSGVRRLGSVVRGRDSRKRAESNAKNLDGNSNERSRGSTDDREGRRTSIRGDEQIISALRASRESTEHPLAHSVVASPEIKEHVSYFADSPNTSFSNLPSSSDASLSVRRPSPPGRVISTTESTKTIKAPSNDIRESTPQRSEGLPLPQSTPLTDTNTSSGLSGIFGGAGRRFVNNMRSRERGRGRESTNASQSSRSSSIDKMTSTLEDPHASPSIAFSSAFAAGHVDQPPVLREALGARSRPQSALFDYSGAPGEYTAESFQQAQEQSYRRRLREVELSANDNRHQGRVNTIIECPPLPDDDISYSKHQQLPSHDPTIAVSSSDDQMTSGISETFSHPSIPSVVSGTSSMSTPADEQRVEKQDWSDISLMSASEQIDPSLVREVNKRQALNTTDDDEAGYNGDGDEEEDESDDEGIIFGKKA